MPETRGPGWAAAVGTYPPPVHDLVIRGARLVGGSGAPVDVVVDGGRVGSVRTSPSAVLAARSLDADGRWLMPGLWDCHVHPTDWAAMRHRVDLREATTTAQCVAAVERRLRERPGQEVVAAGLWCAGWQQRPTRTDLDSFDVPVTLLSGDSHSAVLNAAALARYRLTADADDDGWVTESAWFAVMPSIGSADEATRDRWVVEAGREAAARGVVGVVDLDPHDTHEAWRRRVAAGFDSHRVRAGVWIEHLDAAIAADLCTGDLVPGAGPLVRMGPLKVIADGSLNTRTAYCRHPFADGDHGGMNIAQPELVDAMARARRAGIDATIHAIGDAALTLVLDAFEAIGAVENGPAARERTVHSALSARRSVLGRWGSSVEHVQLASQADIGRMARLGLAASIQPQHLVDDRDVADVLWAGRTDRAYAYAEMAGAGIELRLGSDAPVAPLDPWLAVAAAVLRTGDDRPAWHPEQRIGLDLALRSSWGGVHDVSPGGPADLALLDADPLAADAAGLPAIGVAATICAGEITHIAM